MGLGGLLKHITGGQHHSTATYEDIEGLAISLGVVFALLLPGAMALQNISFDGGVQAKNFLLVLCTQQDFRGYVVETLDQVDPGQAGAQPFNWNLTLGGEAVLDTKAILESGSLWQWQGGSPESIYPCGAEKELAAAARAVFEAFPAWRFDTWALMHPDIALWSDHLNAMSSFCMSILMAGLLGSLSIYISLALSAGREDESGAALAAWNSVGFPVLGCNLLVLMAGIIVLLFANDAYSESQDMFFLRSQRFGSYAKIALLAIFVPLAVTLIAGSVWSLVRSCRRGSPRQPAQINV